MLVILLIGLLTCASLFLIFRVIFSLIENDDLGDKFKVCIPHSLCPTKEEFASKKNSNCKGCYNKISPIFQDVYMDIFQYYKEKGKKTKKKYLINMKTMNTHLHLFAFCLVPLLFITVIAKEYLLDLIDYEVFDDFSLMTFIILLFYITVSLYSFTLIFSFVKMTKINQESDPTKKQNILSLDPTTTSKSQPSNLYNKVYNEVSMFGLISMILVIILSIFCSLALFLMDDAN
jgi:hypothetical protein